MFLSTRFDFTSRKVKEVIDGQIDYVENWALNLKNITMHNTYTKSRIRVFYNDQKPQQLGIQN